MCFERIYIHFASSTSDLITKLHYSAYLRDLPMSKGIDKKTILLSLDRDHKHKKTII